MVGSIAPRGIRNSEACDVGLIPRPPDRWSVAVEEVLLPDANDRSSE